MKKAKVENDAKAIPLPCKTLDPRCVAIGDVF